MVSRGLCLISIGANIGDRSRNIRLALKAVAELPGTHLRRVSRLYETSPVGARGQRSYLNCCAELSTRLSLMGLFIEFKRIEAALGRRLAPRWAPRPIDLDLLFYGTRKLRTRFLSIPHPRALKRGFVLAPLADVRPDWIPPARPKRTVREWLRRLKDPSQNVTVYSSGKPLNYPGSSFRRKPESRI